MTTVLVSWLRFTVSQTGSDPEIEALIGGLSIASHRFSSLWARHEVKQKTSGPLLIDHPQVGPMDLRYRSFVIPGTSQALVTYYAEPGSATDEGLRLLSSLTTSTATRAFTGDGYGITEPSAAVGGRSRTPRGAVDHATLDNDCAPPRSAR